MHIIFLRHGQTELNAARKAQGWCDSYLSPDGEIQIKEAGKKLENIRIDQIISSPLGRAMTTAREAKKYHDVPFSSSSLVMEYSVGTYEGVSLSSESWLQIREGFYLKDEKYSEGESLSEVNSRLEQFFLYLLKDNEMKNKKCILVVSHGGIMHSLLLSKENDYNERNKIINTKIPNATTLQFELSLEDNKPSIEFIDFEDLPTT